MRLWKRSLSVLVGAGLLAMAFSGSALAKEEREKITSVKLIVESGIEAGSDSSDVTVSSNGDNYDVTDVSVVNDEGDWVSGDVPRVEVTLEADPDYYFASMSKSKVGLSGDKATYVSSHREDSSSTLIITIKLDELEGSMEIESVQWDGDNSPVAVWEPADGAKSYQVRLYRGSSSVGSAVTTSNESYNFSGSITREGEYYFKVRAINNNNKKGDWYESDYIYVDEEMLDDIKSGQYNTSNGSGNTTSAPGMSQTTGTWLSNQVGWWYQYPDGTYPTNGWLLIDGAWYCFDGSGYMRTGWIQAGDGRWYYCGSSGAMLTNTWTPDNYWVDANGVWDQSKRR